MPLEAPVNDISDLNEIWPTSSDLQSFADDHVRNCKTALKGTFKDLGTAGGVVTATADELNHLDGVVANVQQQLDNKVVPWSFVTTDIFDPVGNAKLLIDAPLGGMVVNLPVGVPTGTEIRVKRSNYDDETYPDPDTTHPIFISRQGTDIIVDLDAGTAGLMSITLDDPRAYWLLVYEQRSGAPNEWQAWQVPREIA